MKKGFLFLLLGLFLSAGVGKAMAQEKSAITVKGTELNNGVVIVEIVKAGKVYELQCNQGAGSCTPLKGGKYQMIELPINTGMYDCKNVEVYSESPETPEAKKIGDYCLITK